MNINNISIRQENEMVNDEWKMVNGKWKMGKGCVAIIDARKHKG